jgi:predicted flavoprotein YhiN
MAISFGDRKQRGEAIVTSHGLEGGAVYALFSAIRDELANGGTAEIHLDLRPDTTAAELEQRLSQRGKQSVTTWLRKAAGLTPVAAALVREPGPLPQDPAELAARIKDVPLVVSGIRPLDRAISTAGGLSLTDLDPQLMLKHRPGTCAAGEMLDWEAPTGGYLLQASLATGFFAGRSAVLYNPTK